MNIKYWINKILMQPSKVLEDILRYPPIAHFISDELCISILYRLRFGNKINLKNPQSFNEKLLWLTLHDRNPEYIKMVDKYEAKGYIKKKLQSADIPDDCIIPTYGVYDHFDEIDFSSLPESFVMKTTHDSGSVVVVHDKAKLDKIRAKSILEKSLNINYFWFSREWAYKGVKPRIIIEEMIITKEKQPIDYKLFCFNGKAKILYLVMDRDTGETVDYYDMDFNHLPIKQVYNNNSKIIPKPLCWDEMVKCAEFLSKDKAFLRVDFYVDANNKYYIGELTLTPSSGLLPIEPKEWDLKIGEMVDLNIVKK